MGKITGKKRKLDYRPILWVGGIAIPLLVVVTILAWPKKPIPVRFEAGPAAEAHVSKAGNVRIHWTTNLPARGSVYYRFGDDQPFDELSTQLDTRGVVSIPAKAGRQLEFYVEVSGLRSRPVRSENFRVDLLPPLATQPTNSKK